MKITVETEEKATTVSLSGQLDTLSSIDFEKEVVQIIEGPSSHVVLNCGELTYTSSAGLRLLLTLQKGMKSKGGTLCLKNVMPAIMDIFRITGFTSILTIE